MKSNDNADSKKITAHFPGTDQDITFIVMDLKSENPCYIFSSYSDVNHFIDWTRTQLQGVDLTRALQEGINQALEDHEPGSRTIISHYSMLIDKSHSNILLNNLPKPEKLQDKLQDKLQHKPHLSIHSEISKNKVADEKSNNKPNIIDSKHEKVTTKFKKN